MSSRALKWHFSAIEAEDDRGISQTRGLACELVAWRFVTHLTEREAIDHLCYELSSPRKGSSDEVLGDGVDGAAETAEPSESMPLLDEANADQTYVDEDTGTYTSDDATSFASTFAGLNALEVAAVAEAKKFLSQKAIQRVIDGIWKGDIVFWDTFGQHSRKQAKIYNRNKSDPFSRLRVPLYLKAFEALFLAVFLALYYTVLVQETGHRVSAAEILLYIWLASFTYNGERVISCMHITEADHYHVELVEFWDAGATFYAVDYWAVWDLGIIATGIAFLVVRVIGLVKENDKLTDTAFDVLAVEALFLVPR